MHEHDERNEAQASKTKEILVVEDHFDTAQMLILVLEGEGFIVMHACDAGKALQLLTAGLSDGHSRPDLILLDLTMSDLDPVEMIKSLEPDAVPPVIVMSAKPERVVAAAARDIGAVGIVHKPFSIDHLLATVKHALV